MNEVKVTLVKSLIGRNKKHIATAHSLGLNKIGSCIVVANDAVAQGKINVLAHLVKVENV